MAGVDAPRVSRLPDTTPTGGVRAAVGLGPFCKLVRYVTMDVMAHVDVPVAVENPLGDREQPPRPELVAAGNSLPKLKVLAKASGLACLAWPVAAVKAAAAAALGVSMGSIFTAGIRSITGHAMNVTLLCVVNGYGFTSLYVHARLYAVWSQQNHSYDDKVLPPMAKLQKLRVTPAGAAELKSQADGQAVQVFGLVIPFTAMIWAFWHYDISDCPEWVLVLFWVHVCFVAGTLERLCVGTCRACTIIVRDQVQQCTANLVKIVERSELEGGDVEQPVAWNSKATMQQLDHVQHKLIPLCEQYVNPLVMCFGMNSMICGVLFTYLGGTGKISDSLLPNAGLQFGGVICYVNCFDLLKGPMSISNASVDLLKVANRARVSVSVEQSREVDVLIDFLKDQNALRGPGYTMFGQLVTPATFWSACGGVATMVVGTFVSSI